jgi:hypothetical protein
MKEMLFLNPHRKKKNRKFARKNPVTLSSSRNGSKPSGRSRRRRSSGGNGNGGGGMGGIKGAFAGLFDRDSLATVGGAVGGTLLTGFVMRMLISPADPLKGKPFATSVLPGLIDEKGVVSQTAVGLYSLAIPVLASLPVRRFSPGVAKGMQLGAAINGASALLTKLMQSVAKPATATAGTAAYLSAARGLAGARGVGALPTQTPLQTATEPSGAFQQGWR